VQNDKLRVEIVRYESVVIAKTLRIPDAMRGKLKVQDGGYWIVSGCQSDIQPFRLLIDGTYRPNDGIPVFARFVSTDQAKIWCDEMKLLVTKANAEHPPEAEIKSDFERFIAE